MAGTRIKLAVTSAATAAALAVGLCAPAPASALTLPPIGADVTAIVNCTIALVEQLVFSGRPGSDCFGVP
jgi:hypothetical protein